MSRVIYGAPETPEEARRLASGIYRLFEQAGASPEVLALAGSLFDTMTATELSDLIESHLNTGSVFMPESRQ